ncbi:MAG TPA: acyltransferase family protein [Candidatus Binatia bacterium]|nr:acyltransferase family protein [Candidatus Binatia bacterium]
MAGQPGASARLSHLDNLKWVLIAGVIVSHAATAYGAIGSWPYVEPSLGSVTKAIVSVLTEAGDLFALGTFMLVAGLLTPMSFVRKGSAKFLRDRLLRLGAPVVVAVVVVYPLVVWMIVAVTGYPLTLSAFVQWQLRWLVPGPMWFMAVLLLFTLGYAVWRWARPPREPRDEAFQMRHLLLAAALIAVLSFAIRLAFPVGSFQPLDAHLWQWPQLAVLFAMGVLAGERGWLARRPSRLIRRACWVAAPVTVGVLFAIVAVSGSDMSSGSGMALFAGGWHWQAAAAAAAEGVVAVAGSLAMIDLFRQIGAWSGRLVRALGRASYGAYFLQLPVLTTLELALWRFRWPGEVKLALTAPAGIVISFTLAWAARRTRSAARGRQWRTTGSQPNLSRGSALDRMRQEGQAWPLCR